MSPTSPLDVEGFARVRFLAAACVESASAHRLLRCVCALLAARVLWPRPRAACSAASWRCRALTLRLLLRSLPRGARAVPCTRLWGLPVARCLRLLRCAAIDSPAFSRLRLLLTATFASPASSRLPPLQCLPLAFVAASLRALLLLRLPLAFVAASLRASLLLRLPLGSRSLQCRVVARLASAALAARVRCRVVARLAPAALAARVRCRVVALRSPRRCLRLHVHCRRDWKRLCAPRLARTCSRRCAAQCAAATLRPLSGAAASCHRWCAGRRCGCAVALRRDRIFDRCSVAPALRPLRLRAPCFRPTDAPRCALPRSACRAALPPCAAGVDLRSDGVDDALERALAFSCSPVLAFPALLEIPACVFRSLWPCWGRWGSGAVGDGRCGRCVGLGGAGGAFVGKLPSSALSSAEPWGWDVADRIRVIHAAMYLKGPTRARVWPAPQADTDTLHMTPPGGTSLCVHVTVHAWCVSIPWSCQWSDRAGRGLDFAARAFSYAVPSPTAWSGHRWTPIELKIEKNKTRQRCLVARGGGWTSQRAPSATRSPPRQRGQATSGLPHS